MVYFEHKDNLLRKLGHHVSCELLIVLLLKEKFGDAYLVPISKINSFS